MPISSRVPEDTPTDVGATKKEYNDQAAEVLARNFRTEDTQKPRVVLPLLRAH